MLPLLDSPTEPKRLLIAAHDPKLVRVSTKFYARKGYNSHGATGLDDLLVALDRFRPQVVLLSAQLGEVVGFDSINNLKAKYHDCNILVFSKRADAETVKKAWRAGAFYFLKQGASRSEIVP